MCVTTSVKCLLLRATMVLIVGAAFLNDGYVYLRVLHVCECIMILPSCVFAHIWKILLCSTLLPWYSIAWHLDFLAFSTTLTDSDVLGPTKDEPFVDLVTQANDIMLFAQVGNYL